MVAGIITSIIFDRLVQNGQNKSKGRSEFSQLSISAAKLQELESLKIEKDIIKEGIAKIYTAFREDKISKLEYDRLSVKYTEDLRIVDERIKGLQSVVDIFELRDLRNGLVSLIENRINNIDKKLDMLSSSNSADVITTNSKVRQYAEQGAIKSQTFGEQIQQSATLEQTKIEKLQKEVLAALSRLDNFSEGHLSNSSNANKDIHVAGDGGPESLIVRKKRKRDAMSNFS